MSFMPFTAKDHPPIRLVEVGARDGLQNESQLVSSADKSQFIQLLAASGLKTIEATSFVRSDKIAQMGNAKELYQLLTTWAPNELNLPCLVPNLRGLEDALSVGVKEIAVFTATSESFNKQNINATIAESFERIEPLCIEANKSGLRIRAYLSTVFGCPYEGVTSVDQVYRMAEKLFSFGAYDLSLGDTIGVAHPVQVYELCEGLKQRFDLDQFSMHFHDTRGRALANITAALAAGVTSFDASAGGLGGCPYAKGATGNVATEDVVDLFESMGVQTHVNLEKLVDASKFILQKLGKASASKAHQAFLARTKSS